MCAVQRNLLPESLSETGIDELGSVACSVFVSAIAFLLLSTVFTGIGSRGAIGRNFFAGFNSLQNAHLNAEYSYCSCDTIPILGIADE